MPTLSENLHVWGRHNWSMNGDEWSNAWGGTTGMWYGVMLPRIHSWLPCRRLLEIAPGFGRWTQFLKDQATHLMAVDLVAECIEGCRERFSDSTHIEFFVNDGRSLSMIADGSIDFAFSFDALVHVQADVMQAYVHELGKKLAPDGVAFIHHSNLSGISRVPLALNWLADKHWRLAKLAPDLGWRDPSVSAPLVEQWCHDGGLVCRSQELVTWSSRHLTDCFSVMTPVRSKWARPNTVVRNPHFRPQMSDAVAACEQLYR